MNLFSQLHRVNMCGKISLIFGFLGLVACSEHLDICKPIELSKAEQSVQFDFEIKKRGNYQFSLLLVKGENFQKIKRRLEFFGSAQSSGVIIPVSLRIIKDDQAYVDEKINTKGVEGGRSIYYQDRRLNTAIREIKTFGLPPGHYSAVITTLEKLPVFDGIESFVGVSYYNPKI